MKRQFSFRETFAGCSELDAAKIRACIIRAGPPRRARATVSSFADWIFETTQRTYRSPITEVGEELRRNRLSEGAFAHRDIEIFRLWYDRRFPGAVAASDWELFFADDHSSPSQVFESSRLLVADQPLRGIPDVVLRNRRNSDFVVIERKYTRVPEERIPANGWPNLRAQLWCYAWMDQWADTREVYLIAQIWARLTKGGRKLVFEYPRWCRSNPRFDASWCEFFGRFGGQVKERRG